ncbi:hypothetical protein VTN77DRAFT_6383 [Rasamsonia byssochlamydoides]|uniref:uncharacterized protein n=1 Tax=Rasamsonia byssochlamydoides TaxID=89139 RepID=UPI0037446FD8
MAKRLAPVTEAWFSQPRGTDFPGGGFLKSLHRRPCRVTFLDAYSDVYFDCKATFVADSQSPQIILTVAASLQDETPRAHLVFGLQDNDVAFGIEKPGNSGFEKIKELRSLHAKWFEGKDKMYFAQITPRGDAVRAGQPWLLDTSIRAHVLANKPQHKEDNDPYARTPEHPWLWSAAEGAPKRTYAQFKLIAPYFLDDHERRIRLIEAMKAEREEQRQAVLRVWNPGMIHTATIKPVEQEYFHVHVKARLPDNAPFTGSELAEMTEVKYSIKAPGESINDIVLSQNAHNIVVSVKPNLSPVEEQIKALNSASAPDLVFGDKPGNHVQGFSLMRTVLAHASEVDPANIREHFVLDICRMTTMPESDIRERLDYIPRNFPLDPDQQLGYDRSVRQIVCGISLIQGPPGTGKTHTAVAIILTVAALDQRVLRAASSNKGVDNLTVAVIKALNKHPQLKRWCGQVVRVRTMGHQISVLRTDTYKGLIRQQSRELSDADTRLEQYQMSSVAVKYTEERREDNHCDKFLSYLAADRRSGLKAEESDMLLKEYKSVSVNVLSKSKIVATTLSNASHEQFRADGKFAPDFLVCDDSSQCMEGDHMIAMTFHSLKAVVLLGDPEQLQPTVISENSNNEGAKYIKRSLMERLHEAGYPCTMLSTNYRSHPDILQLFNEAVYDKTLLAAPVTSAPNRVGNAWDDFTCRRHHSTTPTSRVTSWSNREQAVTALQILQELYQHKTTNGDQIRPDDVMLLSPYKAQQKVVQEVSKEMGVDYNENLTVDTAQGQEANVVIYSTFVQLSNIMYWDLKPIPYFAHLTAYYDRMVSVKFPWKKKRSPNLLAPVPEFGEFAALARFSDKTYRRLRTRLEESSKDFPTWLTIAVREYAESIQLWLDKPETRVGIELDQLSWTDETQDQLVSLYIQLVEISFIAKAANLPAYTKLVKKLFPQKSQQYRYSTPETAAMRAFHRNPKEGRDVTTPVYEKIVSFFRRFDCVYYFAPYTSIVGPSGIGKSFVVQQIARQGLTYVVYASLAEQTSKAYPPRSVIANRFFNPSVSGNMSTYLECYIAASMVHVQLCREEGINPRGFYDLQVLSEFHDFQVSLKDCVDKLYEKVIDEQAFGYRDFLDKHIPWYESDTRPILEEVSKTFREQTTHPIRFSGFLASLLPRTTIHALQECMVDDVDMRRLWTGGYVFFNHFTRATKAITDRTLRRAWHRGMALLAPQGFKAYDLVIPVGLPEVNKMTYLTVQVKNRKDESLTDDLRTEASDLMRTAAKILPEAPAQRSQQTSTKFQYAWPGKRKGVTLVAVGLDFSLYPGLGFTDNPEQELESREILRLLKSLLGNTSQVVTGSSSAYTERMKTADGDQDSE